MPRATKLQKNRDGKLVSAKAKSKDPACSAAASAFAKLRSGGTAPPDLYTTLAKCRAKARNNQSAANQRAAGNEGKAQVLERRADRGLTGAQRIARAKELIAQRKAKAAPAPAAAKPSLREQVAAHRKGIGRDNPQGRAWTAAARKNELASFREGRAAAEADPGRYRNSTHRQMYLKQGNTVEGALGTFASKSYAKDEDWMAARNLKARRSGIESGLRRAAKPPTAPAKPSALEQARSARAAKGDRTTRLKALAEKSMSLAESRATRAGSLSGAAQDRMIDRSMAAAGRYNRLEAARTPYTPPAKAKAPTPSRSTPERQAAVQAAKDRLFGSRLDRAFAKLEGPKGSNFQGLDKVRSAVPYKPDEFVQRLRTQRQQGRYSLDSFEGAAGKITPELKAAQIAEGGTRFAFLSRNNAEPYTPRKASTQAKAATAPKAVLAPGRGTAARMTVAAAVRDGRRPMQITGEYASVPRAGNNVVNNAGLAQEGRARRAKLNAQLNTYERAYAEGWRQAGPNTKDDHVHSAALAKSGLTDTGLTTARAYAGKKASAKPGIFYPNASATPAPAGPSLLEQARASRKARGGDAQSRSEAAFNLRARRVANANVKTGAARSMYGGASAYKASHVAEADDIRRSLARVTDRIAKDGQIGIRPSIDDSKRADELRKRLKSLTTVSKPLARKAMAARN